jgi:hypothetical protein
MVRGLQVGDVCVACKDDIVVRDETSFQGKCSSSRRIGAGGYSMMTGKRNGLKTEGR